MKTYDVQPRGDVHLGRTRLRRLRIHNAERRAQRTVRDARFELEVRDVEDGGSCCLGPSACRRWDCRTSARISMGSSERRRKGREGKEMGIGDVLAIKGLNVSLIGSPLPTGALMKSYRSASG